MENFTPIASALGGGLIGLSAAALLLFSGKIAGISGIAGGLTRTTEEGDAGWRVAFLAGLLIAGALGMVLMPDALSASPRSSGVVIAAGLLVGLGTRIGNGCTSGHGVCGASRMSKRSLVATAAFVVTAGITVFVSRHVVGGAL